MDDLVDSIKALNNDDSVVLHIDARQRAEDERISSYVCAVEKGLQEGREKGLQEGREKGVKETALKVAKNMKAKGLESSLIAEVTGLSKEEVEAL